MTSIVHNMIFEVSAREFAPAEFNELEALLAKISHLKAKIERDFIASSRYKAALDCAGSDLSIYNKGKSRPSVALVGAKIVVGVFVDLRDDTPTPPAVNRFSNLPEKTMNLLLSGKLISDVEKRRLIRSMTGGILDATPKCDAE